MIESQLSREPKPRLRPFFSTRVLASARERRDRRIMRLYWSAALVASVVVAWQTGLVAVLCCGLVVGYWLLPEGWRRLYWE